MPEVPTKIRLPTGQLVDGVDVPIEESTERWTELKLEDETIIRIKTVITSVARVEGQYDQEGNPVYVVKSAPVVSIVSVPDHLRRKVN